MQHRVCARKLTFLSLYKKKNNLFESQVEDKISTVGW